MVRKRPEMSLENFDWEHLNATPLHLDLDPTLTDSSRIDFAWTGEAFSWWAEDGTLHTSPFSLNVTDFPLTLLVHAHGHGSTTLSMSHSTCPDTETSVTLHSQIQPPLSGHAREEAPWLERTQVFNKNEQVWAGLSPHRNPERIDSEVDVYIVEHRNSVQWSLDTSLTDITPSDVGTHTITGDSIEENRWLVWDELRTLGPSRTADYDVIFDFDRNGELNPGDMSYGPGDEHGGITIMGDLSGEGGSEVESFTYSGGWWRGQKVYYPEDISTREPAPLVVISHGNGHDYLWYDYLGEHLASHGYVVMSHQNQTGPGIETSSTTTLENTDLFLQEVDDLDDGAMARHVDGTRIVWIGHSRGGEGVVRAYDRMLDEGYDTDHYSIDDIVLISSIAPTIFNTVADSDPHDKPYHILAGAADGDVTGGPNYDQVQYFRMTSAAEGPRQTTYLQGVGHNEFNCCGFDDATGPDLIGRAAAQDVAKSYYLALIRAYADEHTPSLDFFKRRADVFRPYGLDDDIIIANEYRPDPDGDALAVDDFQTGWDEDVASSDATVSYTVESFFESHLDDGNTNLSWSGGDPMNGMTQGCCDGDQNRGAVFQWEEESRIEWALTDTLTNLNEFSFLSIRAAQGTRHELTTGHDGPLDFSITLVDDVGNEASIWTGDLGQITAPYPRSGLGSGSGWANEFNTIRVRIASFQDAEPALDLEHIQAIQLNLGGDYGTAYGRLGIDDLLLEY
jgi:hypothetical protein